jgi:hypothetical protein
MAHLFVNRPRLHALTSEADELFAQFRWETANAIIYLAGGIIFVAGSVLFFPQFHRFGELGAWIFLFGSLLYLAVTGHDLAEAVRHRWTRAKNTIEANLEVVAAFSYLSGTILFTLGSAYFVVGDLYYAAGGWCFVTGSLLFVLGACINVLQIVQARSLVTLQLMNLTAVSFVVGSVLFTVASVPYLWDLHSADDRQMLYSFLAWQYLVGSMLFLLGGIFNYRRAWILIHEEMDSRDG